MSQTIFRYRGYERSLVMAEYAIPALCWIAAIGITGYIEFAARAFREEGFDRG